MVVENSGKSEKLIRIHILFWNERFYISDALPSPESEVQQIPKYLRPNELNRNQSRP